MRRVYDSLPISIANMPNRPDVPTSDMPPRPGRALSYVGSLTPHLFVPSRERPVRAKARQLAADTQVMPHSHPWAQVAISTTGVIRLTVDRGTYIVPPSRALWIPPGVEHAVTMVESADLRTLYFHQPRGRCGPGALGVAAPTAPSRPPGASAGCWRCPSCCAPWCARCPRRPTTAHRSRPPSCCASAT